MNRLEGKVALVTGGASGIGKACAERLAQEGAKVFITDIDDEGGRAVADGINQSGGTALYASQDVVSEDTWVATVAAVKEAFGGLNILVNNAGIGLGGPVTEMTLEDWRKQTSINIDGVFLGTKHSIPLMKESGGGSIVNISSVAGLNGAPGMAGYCATKGAVRLFSKAVALECAANEDNIRVNSVHPGIIDTPIWTKIAPDAVSDNAAANLLPRVEGSNAIDPAMLALVAAPLKRAGGPDEIAAGVAYLASDDAAYVTGTELVIDGGMVAG